MSLRTVREEPMKKTLRTILSAAAAFAVMLAPVSCVRKEGAVLVSSAEAPAKSFCWRVRSETGTVYLLGSVHVGTQDMFPLSENVEQAFEESKCLIVEVDPDSVDPETLRSKLLCPAGETLIDYVSTGTYQRLLAALGTYGMTAESASRLKPGAAVTMLVAMKIAELGYDPAFGIDKYFLERARGNKDVLELEKMDDQLALMDAMGEDYIIYSLEDMARWDEDIEVMMTAWRTGDAAAMDAYFAKCLAENPELRGFLDKFLYQRNKAMAGKIEECLKQEGPCFAIVGAAHLVGREGIINLLRQRNEYRIEQMLQ